jgi:predicted permease
LLACLLFGALPAVAASRTRSDAALRQVGPRHGGGQLRLVLIGAEVALALVLATGAGLLLRSYVLLMAVVPGFTTDHVLTMQLWFPERAYDGVRRGAFLTHALERIRSLPQVEAAGAGSWLPLVFDALRGADVQVKGHPREIINTLGVTPGYFRAIGTPLVAGRVMQEGERNVFVVNEAFCKRYGLEFSRAVGERILLDGKPRTVAGVVHDMRDLALTRGAEPTAFLPYADMATPYVGLAVRSASDPKQLVSAIREEIIAIEPGLAVSGVQTVAEVLSGAVAQPRFHLTLLGAFAGLAVGLAALGVYGTIAYFVSQRRNEIGLRMALGAQTTTVIRHVLARGMIPVAVGVALGVPGALASTRLLRTMLYGVGPFDVPTFILTVLLTVIVALGACWLPARRAARIDPMEALRHE